MKKLFDCAMDIGEQMLISGGEVHRVEDSLRRILCACGAKRVDVFIITSSMVVTIQTCGGESFTRTRRITDTSSDYERLHRLNSLSRRICSEKLSAEDIRRELDDISASKSCPLWLEFICYAVLASAFSLFFGGGVYEAASAFVIGLAVRGMIFLSDKTVNNKIFAKFFASFAATALANLSLYIGIIPTVDNVITGAIMTLVPGIGLTNAVRDLFVGDSIAGLLRTIEACMIALAIAAGYFLFSFLTGGAAL